MFLKCFKTLNFNSYGFILQKMSEYLSRNKCYLWTRTNSQMRSYWANYKRLVNEVNQPSNNASVIFTSTSPTRLHMPHVTCQVWERNYCNYSDLSWHVLVRVIPILHEINTFKNHQIMQIYSQESYEGLLTFNSFNSFNMPIIIV